MFMDENDIDDSWDKNRTFMRFSGIATSNGIDLEKNYDQLVPKELETTLDKVVSPQNAIDLIASIRELGFDGIVENVMDRAPDYDFDTCRYEGILAYVSRRAQSIRES